MRLFTAPAAAITAVLIIAVFSLPALAEITLTSQMKSQYTLSDKIEAVFTALSESEGIFTLKIECNDYQITYFANTIEPNTTKTFQAPAIKATEKMLGACTLNAEITSFSNENLLSYQSEPFTITNKLEITMNTKKNAFLPSEQVQIIASGAEKYSERKLYAETFFNNEEQKFSDINNINIMLNPGMRSGSYSILAVISDDEGNSAEQELEFTVSQVAKTIRIELDADKIKPGSTLTARATLLDQAGDEIKEKKITTLLANAESIEIGSLIISSGEKTAFSIPSDAPPGRYTLTAEAEQIKNTAGITIIEVKQIQTIFEGGTAVITNTGNVDYTHEITLTFTGETGNYTLRQKISLKPGEKTAIDASKEIPGGSYTAKTDGMADAKISFKENRSIIKRTADGISTATGAFVGISVFTSLIIPLMMLGAIIITAGLFYKKKINTEKAKTAKFSQNIQQNFYKKQ
jgi:hypothetical protein